ncbi:perilipin-2-like isoform X2 [Toxotes jaculatrix]|uniref:perilipin-2-like isoform X2 n=1 Tax=Toxotes jaculatrix TaxID=941984 RepID=UPI001B3B18D3|nr:perilipin-2-like isoform X2 [Toxotes jaculatrix]
MNQHRSGVRNMPMNNNQKVRSAAARLAELPVVHSACTKLSVLYTVTKCSHPNLKTVCEVLENSVTALGTAACIRVSPVIVKLEPQISTANDVACKSLDWLETTFPVLHSPTEQIVATAKNKIYEIQDVVSITANGTKDCVQHTVTWVMERMQPGDDGIDSTLVERAISVAIVGLDSALSISEALVDQVLPPSEEDRKEPAAHLVEGFEAATLRRNYPARVVSLTAKLCQRTYHMVVAKMHSVQVCSHGDFVQIFNSGSESSDNLADLDPESPRAASVPAASGSVSVVLYLPDVQPKLPTV